MTPAEWGKLLAPVAVAALASFGVTEARTGDKVNEPAFDELRTMQRADALSNCVALEDLKDDIRETLARLVPPRQQDIALAKFIERDCDEEIGETGSVSR